MPGSSSDTLQRFYRDHAHIFGLAAELKGLLQSQTAPDPQALTTARWYFASAMLQHLALKERYVYSKLERDTRPTVKAYSQASKADLLMRFASYSEHMEAWPTAMAIQNWSLYRPQAIAAVDRFIERLKWEETDLLAFVAQHNIDVSEPGTVTSNWVRKAFSIKNSVELR